MSSPTRRIGQDQSVADAPWVSLKQPSKPDCPASVNELAAVRDEGGKPHGEVIDKCEVEAPPRIWRVRAPNWDEVRLANPLNRPRYFPYTRLLPGSASSHIRTRRRTIVPPACRRRVRGQRGNPRALRIRLRSPPAV